MALMVSAALIPPSPRNAGETEVGLAKETFHSGSAQAPVKPRVDKLSFLGRSLLWDDLLFKVKLRRNKIISRKNSSMALLFWVLSVYSFCLSPSQPLRTHPDNTLYTSLGGTQISASLQSVLGNDLGISHLHTSMNVEHLILDRRQ